MPAATNRQTVVDALVPRKTGSPELPEPDQSEKEHLIADLLPLLALAVGRSACCQRSLIRTQFLRRTKTLAANQEAIQKARGRKPA
jgi:hypothetical protein